MAPPVYGQFGGGKFGAQPVRHRDGPSSIAESEVHEHLAVTEQLYVELAALFEEPATSGPYSLKYYQFDAPGYGSPSGSASALGCSDGYIDESCAPSRRRT
jgi:hypothetical protein